ncbi:carbohydrate ABC transporter permease [Enterococcus saccharolyticus]|uniref:carbohydrate ABC transporter permease n=1 Tax=Enterococcus saccharolyticus TaxID=41997 RepID=UPI001E4D00EE|nr:carbohydrate ABC transporter permease [Enterococcus saccharolyticus]MCD5002046.1 carbohydrate ABC transporter permease [Enterococcus saccharolyticus]
MKKKKVNKVQVRSFNPTVNFIFNVIIAIFALSCLLPFFFVIVISLTSEQSLVANGYQFWPEEATWAAYKYIFAGVMSKNILRAFGVTILVTVSGTLVNATMTSLYAYVISRSNFPFRKFFTIFALITMLFTPGMVATYIVVTNFLQLKDTIWALILPLALGPFNILVMRTFFIKTVPDSIIESARIDGASEMKIFMKIVLPLAVPGIATISLFAALGYWNDWFNALLYIQKDSLVPIQYLLMKIQNNLDFLAQNSDMGSQIQGGLAALPSESAKMAIVVISTLPIALTYPFFQRYFVGGLTIGGVKE